MANRANQTNKMNVTFAKMVEPLASLKNYIIWKKTQLIVNDVTTETSFECLLKAEVTLIYRIGTSSMTSSAIERMKWSHQRRDARIEVIQSLYKDMQWN